MSKYMFLKSGSERTSRVWYTKTYIGSTSVFSSLCGLYLHSRQWLEPWSK